MIVAHPMNIKAGCAVIIRRFYAEGKAAERTGLQYKKCRKRQKEREREKEYENHKNDRL